MTTRGFPLAEWCLILAKKDNSLPCASLFTDFSESKKSRSKECKQKIFAAQTPPRKRGYVEDFTLKSVNAHRNQMLLRNLKSSRFALSLKLCREIAARQARGYGVLYEVTPFRHKCYSLCNLTVNRTNFSDQLAVAR